MTKLTGNPRIPPQQLRKVGIPDSNRIIHLEMPVTIADRPYVLVE
jgi:hypothetical protein